ncbi:MAG TPA: hypothetical protein VN782_05070 [Usitatibacter sp.]|nr:hypothetical protein [Usitatibacter sp.]
MPRLGRHRGAFLILAALAVLLAAAALLAVAGSFHVGAARERSTERALALAREALIAYAADRDIDAAVGPGYLPCPDLDGDGWAESTCGSLDGSSGQEQRLGRLPWKTLGLPLLRDGDGEALWYAVSTKYKGLLNCAGSRACVDMSPVAALGTITVRDASGHAFHDGTLAAAARALQGGAVAVVIAPGAPLARLQANGTHAMQRRECAPGDCDADGRCATVPPQRAAPCDPANYLDRASSGEDNAAFVDRSAASARALNADGFIAGPVRGADGSVEVNDRIAAVGYGDVMPAMLRRVALEVVRCLRDYATRPENAARYPWPAASCADGAAFGSAPDTSGLALGSIADTPFARTSQSGSGAMLPRWWRAVARSPESPGELPTATNACRIAVAPDDPGPIRTLGAGTPSSEGETAGFAGNAWWSTWLPFVAYGLARGFAPDGAGTPSCDAGACLSIDATSGAPLGRDKQVVVVASTSCAGAPRCDPALGCSHLIVDDSGRALHGIASYP